MSKLFLGAVAFVVAASPFYADVIPTRRVERNVPAEQKVKARLEQLGVNPGEADRQVRELSPRETAYFAEDLNRVQAATGLYWYEWVGGIAFIVLLGAIVYVATNKHHG